MNLLSWKNGGRRFRLIMANVLKEKIKANPLFLNQKSTRKKDVFKNFKAFNLKKKKRGNRK